MLAVYGDEEVFWQVLDKYGPEIIPVIASYVEDGSIELQIRQTVRNTWDRLWAGQSPKWEQLTREHKAIVVQLAQATRTALTDRDFQQMLIEAGVEPDLDSTPEKFRRSLENDIAHWAPVINAIGLKID